MPFLTSCLPACLPAAQFNTKFHYSRVVLPEKVTHHTALELIWTVIPTMIILSVGIPSLTLIYSLDSHQDKPGACVRACVRVYVDGGLGCGPTRTSQVRAHVRVHVGGGVCCGPTRTSQVHTRVHVCAGLWCAVVCAVAAKAGIV